MPRSNKELEADLKSLKAIIEDYKVEVTKLKTDAADFSLKLIKSDDLQVELERRDAWPEPLTVSSFSDDDLISEVKTRKMGLYAETSEKKPAKKDPSDTLYHAGHYTCNVRSYNNAGKIYNFGSSMTLEKDTRLSERPGLKYFTPGVKTESTSLTPFGEKFNKKVPNTAAAKYQQTFKDNPDLKGQGKGMPTPPGN